MSSVPHNIRHRTAEHARVGRARLATLVACVASVALVALGVGTGHRASSSVGEMPPALGPSPTRAAVSGASVALDRALLARIIPACLGRSDIDERPALPAYTLRTDLSDAADTAIYNGRPVRAVATVRMKVTAYSPDYRSCGASADGITASGYSVLTNGGCMVAADPRVLPLGSLVSVPGYDGGAVVPVLDTGGAIKGNRLDVLYPTHEVAMRWGVQDIEVTVWEYADGLPNGFRRLRRP